MPLTIAPLGKELTIQKVVTDEKSKRHLQNLGVTVGGVVTILSASGGDVVISVKEGRIALNRLTATRIFVA